MKLKCQEHDFRILVANKRQTYRVRLQNKSAQKQKLVMPPVYRLRVRQPKHRSNQLLRLTVVIQLVLIKYKVCDNVLYSTI